MLRHVFLLTLLASCSGGLFSAGSDDEEPGPSGSGAGMNGGGTASRGGTGGSAGPTSGGSGNVSGEAGQGGSDEPIGSAGAAGDGNTIDPDFTIDPTLSPELTNDDLIPTTLEPAVEVFEEESLFTIVTHSGTYELDRDAGTVTSDYFGPQGSIRIQTAVERPKLVTILDDVLTTPWRARLISESLDGSWRLRWDFMMTHVTLRVEKADAAFSFTFGGQPGGTLETGEQSDRLVTSTGAIYGTSANLEEDFLPYTSGGGLASYWTSAVEWSYVYDTITKQSLFLVLHHDDDAVERFQVVGENAVMAFGNQPAHSVPRTFSFGLVDDNVHQLVEAGVDLAVAIDPAPPPPGG